MFQGEKLMSFISKIKDNFRFSKNSEVQNPLFPFFINLESDPQFPFLLALGSLEELELAAKTKREFMDNLLEDIIFTSLYATFYEQLFVTLKNNASHALELIDGFSAGALQREKMIAKLTHFHFEFIKNQGNCPGCEACENHADVAELITPYKKLDLDFFIQLYLGMQTIQYSMEQLLYDVIPHQMELLDFLDEQTILEFRQQIINYTEAKLEQ